MEGGIFPPSSTSKRISMLLLVIIVSLSALFAGLILKSAYAFAEDNSQLKVRDLNTGRLINNTEVPREFTQQEYKDESRSPNIYGMMLANRIVHRKHKRQ